MKKKEILMFKDGKWIKWDGSDVKSLLIKEQITLKQLKKYYPPTRKGIKGEKLVPMGKSGKFAIVDSEDFDFISQWNWRLSIGYAVRQIYKKGSKVVTILMHREINKTPTGFVTDHINGNKLDNRKANLRTCTDAQNLANRGKTSLNKSGYKGVRFHKVDRKWIAQIKVKGKQSYLGNFLSAVDAARAYDEAAIIQFGEFAKLNFPIRP